MEKIERGCKETTYTKFFAYEFIDAELKFNSNVDKRISFVG